MKEILRLLWLNLVLLRRRWELAHAREFRSRLEVTIANERARAKYLLEQSETACAAAEMDIVAFRADKRITSEPATQTR